MKDFQLTLRPRGGALIALQLILPEAETEPCVSAAVAREKDLREEVRKRIEAAPEFVAYHAGANRLPWTNGSRPTA